MTTHRHFFIVDTLDRRVGAYDVTGQARRDQIVANLPNGLSVEPIRIPEDVADRPEALNLLSNATVYWHEDLFPSANIFPSSFTNIDQVDVFGIGGQSNAIGRGDMANSATPDRGTAFELNNDVDTLADPVGAGETLGYSNIADTGSAWPAFAQEYHNQTGRPVAFVQTAVGGSGQHRDTRDDRVHWDTTGDSLLSLAIDNINDALAIPALDDKTVNFRGILWHQGEHDEQYVRQTDYTAADYKTAFTRMKDTFQNNLPGSVPIWLYQIGKMSYQDTTGLEALRQAQSELATDNADVEMVFDDCVTFADRDMMSDTWHYNQAAYNEMGTVSAQNVTQSIV